MRGEEKEMEGHKLIAAGVCTSGWKGGLIMAGAISPCNTALKKPGEQVRDATFPALGEMLGYLEKFSDFSGEYLRGDIEKAMSMERPDGHDVWSCIQKIAGRFKNKEDSWMMSHEKNALLRGLLRATKEGWSVKLTWVGVGRHHNDFMLMPVGGVPSLGTLLT